MNDLPNPAAIADRMRAATPDEDVEAEVEAALGSLETLPDLAVTDHVAVFEGVQQRLSEVLSNVDDA
ncbi:hypothetical protein GCM10029992_51920 [Glycomyces albus]